MMAAAAKYRDDVAGAIITAGTATAYTVTSYQGFDTLAHLDGAVLAFTPHATSGATVTLNVDGLGPRPLRSSPAVELPSGVLIQGTPYTVIYSNADGAFYLRGFLGNPYNVPIGAMLDYTGASAPNSSFVLPFGQAISRTAYGAYFALVGTTYGGGDGATTFNVPDLRGRTTFGVDNMGGSAAGRISVAGGNFDGTVLGGTGGAQNHTLTTAEMPAHNHPSPALHDPGHTHDVKYDRVLANGTAGFFVSSIGAGGANTGAGGAVNSTTGITLDVTTGNTGGGGAHSILNPAIIVTKILRVI
jgi:microcystin-dependent protein